MFGDASWLELRLLQQQKFKLITNYNETSKSANLLSCSNKNLMINSIFRFPRISIETNRDGFQINGTLILDSCIKGIHWAWNVHQGLVGPSVVHSSLYWFYIGNLGLHFHANLVIAKPFSQKYSATKYSMLLLLTSFLT